MPDNLYEATCNARDRLYSSFGNVEPDVIAHAINPAFMGGPAWPSLRHAFSIIRRGDSTLIVSNGLADPCCNLVIPAADNETNPEYEKKFKTAMEKLGLPWHLS
ncbi:MAG: hypothetical protein OEZ39_16375 [Gammaproteobacteria bacterium]|nr:hypothetical protein [Gammaproteobacteria bacterium]MDH5653436.1 hypothetical protein [Gammaproteobacteria bacterium]